MFPVILPQSGGIKLNKKLFPCMGTLYQKKSVALYDTWCRSMQTVKHK